MLENKKKAIYKNCSKNKNKNSEAFKRKSLQESKKSIKKPKYATTTNFGILSFVATTIKLSNTRLGFFVFCMIGMREMNAWGYLQVANMAVFGIAKIIYESFNNSFSKGEV